jgi:septal ring factor EnvC (AmiA/AmiB activator)
MRILKMKSLTKSVLATAMLMVVAIPAYAHHNDRKGDIQNRLERQHTRIEQGIDSGELTRKEAKELKREQRKSRHLYQEFREDGYLSKRERRKLHRRLDRISDQIWDLKHNERKRHNMPHYYYGYDRHGGWSCQHHHHENQG